MSESGSPKYDKEPNRNHAYTIYIAQYNIIPLQVMTTMSVTYVLAVVDDYRSCAHIMLPLMLSEHVSEIVTVACPASLLLTCKT